MRLQCSFLVLCSLLVASSARDFDFFYLVQQWPGSFCSRKCCFPETGKPAADFGIHGLWPNYAQCERDVFSIIGRRRKCWPEYCNDNPLSPWEIKDLVRELERNWPTLSCKNRRSFEFWSYEWQKHGTCSDLDEHTYFQQALSFKAQFNLTQILQNAGIVPSEEETYELSRIKDAIRDATGAAANVECNQNQDGDTQLYQVYQCTDRAARQLIDCPLPMQGNCEDSVKFPIF